MNHNLAQIKAHDASVSQITIAYVIIGVTKSRHVEEAASAAKIKLTETEISTLESLAEATGVDTKGAWENPMV